MCALRQTLVCMHCCHGYKWRCCTKQFSVVLGYLQERILLTLQRRNLALLSSIEKGCLFMQQSQQGPFAMVIRRSRLMALKIKN